MPMVLAAAGAAVTWVGGAYGAAVGLLATPLVGLVGEGAAIALAGSALNMAGVALLSSGINAMMAPKVGRGGSPTSFKADPTAPVRGVMGYFGVGGTQAHMRSWGKENVFLSFVTALSLGPISGIPHFTAGGQVVTFGGSQGMASDTVYANRMWMTYKLGAPTESALAPPSGQPQGSLGMDEWTSAHKMTGHAAAFWTMRTDSKGGAYKGGVPMPQWNVLGMKVWDPRFDSSYPGGSGTQRRDDWRTWEWSQDPYIHALAWARGHFKLNTDGSIDRSKRLAGIGAPDRGIDIAAFVEGANIAFANGWIIGGEWTTADDKWSVLSAMLQAGGGEPLNRGAQISCFVNTPRASILTLTRADLAGTPSLKVMKGRRDRFNTVIPRYRSPDHRWETVAAGAVTSSVYVTQDRGEPRTREIDYAFVTQAKQAAELAAYDLVNAREGLEGGVPFKPYVLGLRAGDAFTMDEPEMGLAAQKFVIRRRTFDPARAVVDLEVRSETDAKHPFALGQSAAPPPTPSLSPVDPIPVTPDADDWTVEPRAEDADGTQQPGLIVTGTVASGIATSLLVEHGPTASGPWTPAYSGPPTAEQIAIDALSPGADRWVSITYLGRSDQPSERLVLGPVEAPGLIALSPDESAALARIAIIESDGWLSKGEKPEVIREWIAIVGEYPGISAQALASGATSQRTTLIAAYSALSDYLSGLDPTYDDLTADTEIVGAALRDRFYDYYVARSAAINATIALAQADADAAAVNATAALARLARIDSDGWLTMGEKPEVIRDWLAVFGEYSGLLARATATGGASTEAMAYSEAYDDLSDFLTALDPDWNDTTTDSAVTPGALGAAFSDYYVARQALLNALIGKVGGDAAAALGRIQIWGSDSWLAKEEKPGLVREWGLIVAAYPGISAQALAIGATSARTDLINAYTALSDYLSGLSPAYNDATQDTSIVPATFVSRFEAYYTAAQAAMNAMLGLLDADLQAALDRLGALADDSILAKEEKAELIREWGLIVAAYPGISAQALAIGATSARTDLINAYTALSDYLSGLSPAYNDATQDTSIVPATFVSRFETYYTAAQAAMNAMLGLLDADNQAALDRLGALADDNILAKEEKGRVVQDWAAILGEYSGLDAQAASRGFPSGSAGVRKSYNDAFTTLSAYLSGLSPAWNDLTQDSPISGTTFRSRFSTYLIAKQALTDAIAANIATYADAAYARVVAMGDDNVLAKEEKAELVRIWAAIVAEKPGLTTEAGNRGVSSTAYVAAYDALSTYLSGLWPAYNDLTADTVIVGTTYRSKFTDYADTKQALQNAIFNRLGTDVDRIASDGWLSRGEKPWILLKWGAIVGEYPGLSAQALAFGVTTPRTTFIAAYEALSTYLSGLSPAYNDTTQDTAITAVTFQAKFSDYDVAKTALQSAMNATAGASNVAFKSGSGNVTRTTPLSTLATTDAVTSSGSYVIDVSGSATVFDGSAPFAQLVLYRVLDGVETELMRSNIAGPTSPDEPVALTLPRVGDTPGAGSLSYRIKVVGSGGPTFSGSATVYGAVTSTRI